MGPAPPDPVDEAFAATPRRMFLPPAVRARAAYDGPLEIGHGQTSSQPWTVRQMLRLLEVRRGDRVLDVGAGSGWTTALLARLVGEDGRVVGVERVPELVAFGSANLAATGRDWASVEQADPVRLGAPAGAPYDRVLVSAEATSLPHELVDQLTDDGRMVIPVRGTMLLVVREGAEARVTRHGSYRFVPLL